MKEMILEGVIGIVEGLNPTLIRMKLDAFNLEPVQPSKAARSAGQGKGFPANEPSAEPASGEALGGRVIRRRPESEHAKS
jgi:hypothetical protein